MLTQSALYGLILHTDSEPAEPDRPSSAMVGMWNDFASCVPISANHVISTRHQDSSGGPNTVTIMGVVY